MQKFETGKTYRINGGGHITVTRRTEKFVEYTGTRGSGRKKAYPENLFGLGEHIFFENGKLKHMCFAAHEGNEGGF